MKKYFIFLLALCLAGSSYSQKIIIDGKEGNRPLQWDDFKGSPDGSSPFFANTYWHIAFKFTTVTFKSDTASLKGFEITLDFDPRKSWLKKDKGTDYLLKHEQGHFDIAIVCLRKINHIINSTVFMKADLNTKLQALFSSTLDKYKLLERKYDDETNHSIDVEQQAKWDQFIKDELARSAALE